MSDNVLVKTHNDCISPRQAIPACCGDCVWRTARPLWARGLSLVLGVWGRMRALRVVLND